jgi:hypothetical protein
MDRRASRCMAAVSGLHAHTPRRSGLCDLRRTTLRLRRKMQGRQDWLLAGCMRGRRADGNGANVHGNVVGRIG